MKMLPLDFERFFVFIGGYVACRVNEWTTNKRRTTWDRGYKSG